MHQLEDLDFADDLALLAHTHSQMQEKTTKREALSSKLGVNINTEQTKIMRIKNKSITRITINNHDIEEVTSVTYLGSVINITGGTDEDVLSRIGKAPSAFNILGNISRSREITTATKMRIFMLNVKSVLFYGCETRRMTEKTVSKLPPKLQTSINRCLRRILRIHWPPWNAGPGTGGLEEFARTVNFRYGPYRRLHGSCGTHREADGEGDHLTAGGGIRNEGTRVVQYTRTVTDRETMVSVRRVLYGP